MCEDNEAVDGHPWEQVGCGTAFKLINILYTEDSECKWQNMDRTHVAMIEAFDWTLIWVMTMSTLTLGATPTPIHLGTRI